MVGCVIVKDGVRIGEGWHRRFGGPHAEIEALQAVHGGRGRAPRCMSRSNPAAIPAKRRPAPRPSCGRGSAASWWRRQIRFPPWPARASHNCAAPASRSMWACRSKRHAHLNAPYRMLMRARASVGHREVGHDARRQDRQPHGPQPLDQQRTVARRRAATARTRGRDRWSDAARPWPTIRCSPHNRPVRARRRGSSRTRRRRCRPRSRLVQTAHARPVLIAVGEAADQQRRAALGAGRL